jgi:hypothetical protein
VLDALLDPHPLVGIGDVHVLHADLAAVGPAQTIHDLTQGRRLAQAERAEDQDRPLPVAFAEAVGRRIEIAMRRMLHQAERIEIGVEMAADAIGADQEPGPLGIPGGGADVLLGLARKGDGHGSAVALHVAIGGRRQGFGIDGADDVRAVGCPRRAAHLGEHIVLLLAQHLEEGAPLGIDRGGIAEISRVELFDERRIGAEQERRLLRLHGFSFPPLPVGGELDMVSPSLLSASPRPARREIRRP